MSILKIDEILNVGINKYMQNAVFDMWTPILVKYSRKMLKINAFIQNLYTKAYFLEI